MSDVTTDLSGNQSQNYDAQQLAEEIALGDQKTPKVDIESDYEASKELSVSPVDHTPEGEKMAEDATAPHYQVHSTETSQTVAQPTGNPDDYRKMARDIHPVNAGTGNVTDDLVEKALEKGKPGNS
ncbi:MAG: hypothetical protein SFW36_04560 [Leptolyngbyaceae cyanobacterium bins.59]|nr:hypothetical protein [Leptolyngbyaceae cyanobacterium bins.59]